MSVLDRYCGCDGLIEVHKPGSVGCTHSIPVVKGGGPLTTGAGGMVRSSAEGKADYTLALDGVMFKRWAEHLDRATKPVGDFKGYAKRNWMKALNGTPPEREAVMERAKVSAFRHFLQWISGETDEDHAAALLFNVNLYETVKEHHEDL